MGILLDALFAMGQDAFPDGTTLDLLKVMSNETLSTAEKNRLNQILKPILTYFLKIEALASSTPEVKYQYKTLKGTKQRLQELLPDKNYNAIFKMQGLSDDLKIVEGLRELARLNGGKTDEIIPMSYETLNQFYKHFKK